MADDKPAKTPPYFPWRTFESATSGFSSSGGVPSKLDRSVLSTMSGSGRSAFLVGLRFLNLLDENSHPLPLLEKYVSAEGESQKPILREILTSAYGFLSDNSFDLTRATASQLSEMMSKEGATSSTREKAVSFFLKAAEAGGISVSPHILKRKHTPSATAKPRATKAKKPQVNGTDDRHGVGRDDGHEAGRRQKSPYDVLMHDIYDPAAMKEGSPEEKAVFTLARFLRAKGTKTEETQKL